MNTTTSALPASPTTVSPTALRPTLSRATRAVRRLAARGRPAPVWPERFPGAYLGWGRCGPIFTGPQHHALIVGPPRSGKTTSIIIPAVGLWPGPVVTTSTKPDVVDATAERRRLYGQTWVWDPTGTLPLPAGCRPACWSPMLGCAVWAVALRRAWALVSAARPDPRGEHLHWNERASALLAGLLHAGALDARPLSDVIGWLHRRDVTGPLDQLTARPGTRAAVDLLAGLAQTDGRELSGIYSTAASVLAAYRDPAVLAAADRPNFDPAAFAESTDTLYLVAPAADQAMHAPVVCALLDQIRHHHLTRRAPWPPMLWALDEAANVAPLPTLPAVLADGGGQGLIVLTCLQDLSQARQRWGTGADGFLTLHPTTVLLPGVADTATLRAVSLLAGHQDRTETSTTTTGLWGRTSRTTSTRRLPVLPEDAIARGRPGYALRLCGAQPSWLALTPAHTTAWITRLLEGDHR
jgi:type IV secretion system protein VirD4